jgi:hypothetical protein
VEPRTDVVFIDAKTNHDKLYSKPDPSLSKLDISFELDTVLVKEYCLIGEF